MQNTWFFLKRLVPKLEQKIINMQLSSCFSQEKDELILHFENVESTQAFFIRAILTSQFSSLTFPEQFHRGKANTANLFQQIIAKKVIKIDLTENDRSFTVVFEEDYILLFKLHGNRSNIILFHDDKIEHIFKSGLAKDQNIQLEMLQKEILFDANAFIQSNASIREYFPTFDKNILDYLYEKGINQLHRMEQYALIEEVIREMETNPISIARNKEGDTILSLLPVENGNESTFDAIEALNILCRLHFMEGFFFRQKEKLLSILEKKLDSTQLYNKQVNEKLNEHYDEINYEQIGHILMANHYKIPANSNEIELIDFYRNKPIVIRLKKDLNGLKNAEWYYKKGKNQHLAIYALEKSIDQAKETINKLEKQIENLKSLKSYKELKQFTYYSLLENNNTAEIASTNIPYWVTYYEGFEIWIGKNASSNDKLLQNSTKNDVWLHARNVPGSHVLIRVPKNKEINPRIINRAGEIAAFYSKAKNEKLCPVMVTERKYVRKFKGSKPGEVKVDREKTILVEPMGI